ncbi:MAG: CopG family transcriptional regulator [Thermoanaerobaculia bacterium]
MRTTLEIDDDVLLAAKEIAANRRTTVGRVLSDLVRTSLHFAEGEQIRNGVPLMPRRPKGSPALTMEIVNRLRDER